MLCLRSMLYLIGMVILKGVCSREQTSSGFHLQMNLCGGIVEKGSEEYRIGSSKTSFKGPLQ